MQIQPRSEPHEEQDSALFATVLVLTGALPIAYFAARASGLIGGYWSLPEFSWLEALGGALGFALAAILVALGLSRMPQAESGVMRRAAAALISSLVVAACAYRWRASFVPPDGVIWLQQADHPFLMSSEPLGRWSHYVFFKLLELLGAPSTQEAVRLSSVGAGVFFAGALGSLAPRIFERLGVFRAALLILVTPLAPLYMGLPETTPWAYALIGVYLLMGLRYLKLGLQRAPWPESIVLMLAVATHGMVLFATGAHLFLIALWFVRSGREQEVGLSLTRSGRIVRLIAVAILPFGLLASLISQANASGSGLHGMPWQSNLFGGFDSTRWILFGAEGMPHQYVFGSRRYLLDLANLFLSAGPIVVVVPVLAYRLGKGRPEIVFLMSALAGLLFFTFFWNADFNMHDDFDLMAMFSVPAGMLFALWCEERLCEKRLWAIAIVASSVSFGFTIVPYVRFP